MKNSTQAMAILALTLISGAWATQARAWWNDDWAYRKEIAFDLTPAGADIAGPITDVPVLVRLSLTNFPYFTDSNPDASDFRFVSADDKTPLKFHVERFDTQAQVALLWVRIPQLTGGAKTDKVFLYYGNKKAVNAASAGDTYDANQTLVYHFSAAKSAPQDATAYKSEPSAFTADSLTTSLIGNGVAFSGSQTIVIPANGAVHMTSKGFTLSAWVRIAAAQSNAYLAQLADSGHELVLGIAGNQAFVRYAAGSTPVTVTQSTQLTNAEWHHLAVSVSGGHLTLLVDGADVGHADVTAQDLGGALTIGGSANGNYFTGDLDELEVANVGRSADWLKAAARSQGIVAPLVIYGGDTQRESGGGQSYFLTTLRSVTVDGWVIIGTLAVMLLLAVMIMITKGIFLARVIGGNRRFLAEYRTLSDDPAALERKLGTVGGSGDSLDLALEDKGAFGISPIWTLYHHGMRETLKRLPNTQTGTGQVRTLSAQSIEAIRASLDASLTRLQQRLNSQMVWLTVAISGGPFLGLLGTVVGVMITFAAIAASGQVDINAIAPGTAAALVATVAGLGVAIPCLFGYNYLNTRVKEITADMRVFVDELVARIAETYS